MSEIWNPWHGCYKKSEGCLNCYMYYLDAQRGQRSDVIYKVKNNFNLPLKKDRKENYKIKKGTLLYTCMTSDFFLEEADEWRKEIWDMIRIRTDVIFWILTKRPERIEEALPSDWGEGWDNVCINVTVENQKRADERIPILLELPFKYKGVVAAPILGSINIEKYLKTGIINDVSASGENYAGARSCDYDWIKNLYEQCSLYDTTFNFFETGEYFIKNGKKYHIPKKLQKEQAEKSGLNYRGKKSSVILKEIEKDEQMQLFNIKNN